MPDGQGWHEVDWPSTKYVPAAQHTDTPSGPHRAAEGALQVIALQVPGIRDMVLLPVYDLMAKTSAEVRAFL